MSFREKYRTPEQVTQGVTLTLDDVNFRVALPTEANIRYQRALAVRYARTQGEVGVAQFIEYQLDAFLDTCILECSDPDLTGDVLRDEFVGGAVELFNQAQRLAGDLEADREDVVGKPLDISSGSGDGPTESNSTESLNAAGA